MFTAQFPGHLDDVFYPHVPMLFSMLASVTMTFISEKMYPGVPKMYHMLLLLSKS